MKTKKKKEVEVVNDFFSYVWDFAENPVFSSHILKQMDGKKFNYVFVRKDIFEESTSELERKSILDQIRNNPEWNFLLLAEDTNKIRPNDFPKNAYLGVSVSTQSQADNITNSCCMRIMGADHIFMICTPIEPIKFKDLGWCDWVILGAKDTQIQPNPWWILNIMDEAYNAKCAVFWRPNLTTRFREIPEVVKDTII